MRKFVIFADNLRCMKKLSTPKNINTTHIAILGAVFAAVFAYIFNPALDLGGDNCVYYMYATSIAEGKGYTDLSSINQPPGSTFPPGYPLLMAPLRFITDSIVAQKILNGIFLYIAAIFIYLFIRRNKLSVALAMTAAVVMLLNYRVLEFATIMMSEMSYLMFSAIILWLVVRFDERDGHDGDVKKWWKNPHFWLLVICAGFAYQIRTQGIAIVVAVAVWMLVSRKWLQTLGFIAGFALTTLPWTIRNHVVGLGANRYLDQIFMVNQWRPEEGYISVPDLVIRGFATLKMLVTKAILGTVIPYLNVDYNAPATPGEWLAGLLMLAIIFYGFWQFRRYFWLLASYTVAVLGIICLWSAPSGNRYIVTLVPILETGIVVGVYTLIVVWTRKFLKVKKVFSPLLLLIPAVLIAAGPLKKLSERSAAGVPPAYENYFKVAKYVHDKLPPNTVVCSRKASLFYVYSQVYGCNYKYTEDDAELIKGLIDSKADYVVLEQLGYSSTHRYLYPAIMKNQELFLPVFQLQNPDTYLLKFDREGAIQKFGTE